VRGSVGPCKFKASRLNVDLTDSWSKFYVHGTSELRITAMMKQDPRAFATAIASKPTGPQPKTAIFWFARKPPKLETEWIPTDKGSIYNGKGSFFSFAKGWSKIGQCSPMLHPRKRHCQAAGMQDLQEPCSTLKGFRRMVALLQI
jgi:hypothetical protein